MSVPKKLTLKEAIPVALDVAARIAVHDGWHPTQPPRDIGSIVTRAIRERFPKLPEDKRQALTAGALAHLVAKIKRRWPGVRIDDWERMSMREPEHVVALLGVPAWPEPRPESAMDLDEPPIEVLTVSACAAIIAAGIPAEDRCTGDAAVAALRAALPREILAARENAR